VSQAIEYPAYLEELQHLTGQQDIQDAVILWAVVARQLWYSLSPNQSPLNVLRDKQSFFRESVINSDLSYIRFAYTGDIHYSRISLIY